MDDWFPSDFLSECGPEARFCEFPRGSMIQFLVEDGDVLA